MNKPICLDLSTCPSLGDTICATPTLKKLYDAYNKKITVDTPTPNKVFNYTVQWMETAEAMTRISSVCEFLRESLTKPILYTYDALLLDLHRSETSLLPRIKHLMEMDVYPTRMYKGKNYNELISM